MSNGPKITRDGLVFYYDVNNTKSYVGEPTTNLVNPSWGAWGIDGSGYSTAGTRTIISPYHCRIDDIASNTRQSIAMGGVNENSIYTFSVKYRKIGGTPSLRFQIYSRVGGSYVQPAFPTTIQLGVVDTYEWQTATYNYTTPPGTDLFFWYMQDGDDYTPYTHSFELKEPQVEKKSHETTFVNGTRSSTIGLKDLSRNLTIDISNVSFNSSSQIEFDGTNDFINCGLVQPFDLNSRRVTWESVVKFNNSTGSEAFITRWDNTLGSVWWFGRYPTTKIHIAFIINGGYYAYFSDGDISSTLNYYHITVTLNDTVLSYYINGVLDSTDSVITGTWTEDPDVSLIIGAQNLGTAANFSGEIPISKIYNRALSGGEVLQNYNAIKNRFGI
jgi:hypothetical protein